jgi:hypothetical protein
MKAGLSVDFVRAKEELEGALEREFSRVRVELVRRLPSQPLYRVPAEMESILDIA